MTTQALIGIVAGLLELASFPIYLRSIIRKETKPDRVTWWVFAVVSLAITLSYYGSGARETVWLPASYTVSSLIFAIASLFYGEGPVYLHTLDRISLLGALVSGVIWWAVRSPVPALFLNMTTELTGLLPTMHKAYARPWTESKTSWALGTAAAFLTLFAIPKWTFVIAAYPVYVLLTNGLITYFIFRKRT